MLKFTKTNKENKFAQSPFTIVVRGRAVSVSVEFVKGTKDADTYKAKAVWNENGKTKEENYSIIQTFKNYLKEPIEGKFGIAYRLAWHLLGNE